MDDQKVLDPEIINGWNERFMKSEPSRNTRFLLPSISEPDSIFYKLRSRRSGDYGFTVKIGYSGEDIYAGYRPFISRNL